MESAIVDDMKRDECPVSIIHRHPRMYTLVGEVTGAMAAQQATGSMVYGSDSGKWPIKWFDAVAMVNCEDDRVEIERDRIRSNRQ